MKGLPKKLTICNRTWTIVYSNKESGGGYFYWRDGKIVIGVKDCPRELIVQTLLHEIIEAVMYSNEFRYAQYNGTENGDYLFNFNHKEFEKIVVDVYGAIKPMLKKEVVK